MQKLFASDFDGTLYFQETGELISQENLTAIRAFQETGGLFGACTGRPLCALTGQTGDDIPFDFYIATTGAALYDRDRQLIWNKTVSRDIVHECCELVRPLCKSPEYELVVGGEDYWTFSTDLYLPILRTARSLDEVEGPFYGMGIETVTIDEAHEAAALVREHFAGVLTAYVNLASIDVLPAGCSKGTGLRHLAEYYGADLTAGIGDSFNDLELLDAADVAYTFKSSPEEMHRSADLLVDSAAEALYDFIQR